MGASSNHQSFYRRRYFWSNNSFNNNFNGAYPNIYSHSPTIALLVNNVNMQTTIMDDHAIIQAIISLAETFDVDKNKLEAWIKPVDNAA